jgi:hypothetical protein
MAEPTIPPVSSEVLRFRYAPGVERTREAARLGIALVSTLGYFVLLAVIIIVGWLVMKLPIDDVVKVLTATAGVLGGIVGAIVGFYFRQEG